MESTVTFHDEDPFAGRDAAKAATEAPAAAPEAKATPRELPVRIRKLRRGDSYQDVSLTSRVILGADRDAFSVRVAALRGGMPVECYTSLQLMKHEAIARLEFQIAEFQGDGSKQWADVYRDLRNDESAVIELGGVLADHELRFFLGDDEPVEGDSQKPRVELDPARPG